MLVNVIAFLQRALRGARKSAGRGPVRVLFAALTNVAVDNVLEGLIARTPEGEQPDIVRVGALKRISPKVLPHSTHGRLAAEDEAATKRELERDLQHASASERAVLRQALELINTGKMSSLARAVSKVTVVGATCAATGLPCMANLSFDIVLLDEASQLTEPASMLPLARLKCERLLAVGDPQQLPPTLHMRTPPAVASAAALAASPERVLAEATRLGRPAVDLTLTLFERLALGGLTPVMLKRQYRCHPQISALASRLFYGGALCDGLGAAAAAARAPLLRGLPTIGFVQVTGSEKPERGGSITNHAEASRVVRLIGSLDAAGIELAEVGVICLYKAQAFLCKQLLADMGLIDRGVVVSTVDAFQGAERDVVLVTTCRTTSDVNALRFIACKRRLNVTITRARRHLLLVGAASALLAEPTWAAILSEAQAVPSCFCTGDGSQLAEPDASAVASGDGANSSEVPGVLDNGAMPIAAVDVDAEDADADALQECAPDDPLAIMLRAKRQKEQDLAAMRDEVDAEMTTRMDTGVRVNPALATALGVDLQAAHGVQPLQNGVSSSDGGGHDGALELEGSPQDAVDLLAAGDSDSSDGDDRGDSAREKQEALELLELCP